MEVTYEGTSEVKESRIRLLEQKHHNFKMISGESINSLFSRFADIANPLKSLGAEIPVKGQISKILFALKGKDWISKRIGIEEGADYKTLTIEGLMGKLKAFEETQQHHEEEEALQAPIPIAVVKKENTEKSLAFKALKGQEEDASEDEDSALLSASIKRFMKFNKKGTGNIYGATSNPKGNDKDHVPRCFKCNSKKHMKAYCPVLAKEAEMRENVKKPNASAGIATWGESDAEMLSSDEEDDGFKNGVCFTAPSAKVTSSQVVSDSDSEYDEEYANMCKDVDPMHVLEVASQSLEVLSNRHIKSKKDIRRLENELACMKHELNEMTIKFMEMKDVANKTDGSFMNLTTEHNDALILISQLESKISSLENNLRKGKQISNPMESSMLEIKILELDDANEKISTLEMNVSNLVDSLKEKENVISFKNTDNRLLISKD